MKKLKIIVVYNRVKELSFGQKEDIIADNDTVVMAEKVLLALAKRGHTVSFLELDEPALSQLSRLQADCLFNLCGGINSLPHSEVLAAQALEKTGIAIVGSSSKAIGLTTDKVATKELLLKNSIPTPNYLVAQDYSFYLDGMRFPLIVKPQSEDCSLGISQDSVFLDDVGLGKKINQLQHDYQEPVLVEEYIDGRELRVSIIGNGNARHVLPISELVFGKSFSGKFKIFDFSAKWVPGTDPYENTFAVSPAELDKSVRQHIEKIALLAFEISGCTDYGRVDIRLDRDNIPFILEINANPAIGPDDALATSAKAAGISYGLLLEKIVQSAMNKQSTTNIKPQFKSSLFQTS